MIKTGDWTIADLTKYLASVQSTLTPIEIDRLKATAVFTKEGASTNLPKGQKPARCRAGDLYEPLDIHRQLQLPLIDWGVQTKWRGTSEEGLAFLHLTSTWDCVPDKHLTPAAKFLYRLGLQRFPSLHVIIDTAASSDANLRPIAIKYLIDNIPSRYSDYDPAKFSDVAYIPALAGNVPRVGTPKEVTVLFPYFSHLTTFWAQVFASPDWASLGFLVVPSSLRDDALTKLKISEHPPAPLLVALLEKTPPRNDAQAREWFGILAGRVAGTLLLSPRTLM
jgi:hypothetical protein